MDSKIRVLWPLVLACAMLGIFAGAARGNMVTANCGSFSSETMLGVPPTELSVNLACPQFDPSFGTLTQINMGVFLSFDGFDVVLTNNSGVPKGLAAMIESQLVVAPLSGFQTVNPFPTVPSPILLPPSAFCALPSGQSCEESSNTFVQVIIALSNTADFAPYTGTGTFDVNYSSSTVEGLSGIDGTTTLVSGHITWDGEVHEAFFFTPAVGATPEPSSLALIVAGFLGAALVRTPVFLSRRPTHGGSSNGWSRSFRDPRRVDRNVRSRGILLNNSP